MQENIQNLISELAKHGKPATYQPTEHFVQAGLTPEKIGILTQGLFRYYYLTKEGKEFTKVFMPENNILSSYSAMTSQSPSYYGIQALEPSQVITINYYHWNDLRKENAKWDKLLIFLLEKGYGVKEKREREFLLLDAESRYKVFLQEYPQLENRVRQHMIASYLGITPIALSRIRKKMSFINPG